MGYETGFTMRVEEDFRFDGGRTVLVGPVETKSDKLISAQRCEILAAGVRRQFVRIEGEMIPSNRGRRDLRSISTSEDVQIEKAELGRHEFILRNARVCMQYCRENLRSVDSGQDGECAQV